MGCHAGVFISSSHNPKDDNEYKVYGEDGAQITSPTDKYIQKKLAELLQTVIPLPSIEKNSPCHILKVEEDYYNMVEELVVPSAELPTNYRKKIRIVYTPLNGTGIKIIYPLLQRLGFEKISVVEEQKEPDGDFPTVAFPNPENKNTLALAVKLSTKKRWILSLPQTLTQTELLLA